ncbi:globin domain-containing protein [Rhizobium sp. Leaf341]|uniref:globin domain-containing protein n=1 Tax=Rhizobium sp. Leaf341 TaxID=1736344 RepID=UPI0007163642|nr:globin [Rhizobium sp. Leaf341]KQR69201.1 globin [Rhizobium sp. Leaf341]
MDDARSTTLYDAIGGDATVRMLTRRFYEIMDSAPEAAACRAVHPPSLAGSEAKLYDYLTGWLGGPPLYTDKHGHPMLRRRHFGASIGAEEVEGWLFCFNTALDETVVHPELRRIILEPVTRLAHHMQNQEG